MSFRVSVLLSMQRALWDLVAPSLRGVAVRVTPPGISARFIFDEEPSEDDREDVSVAETHVMADFPDDAEVAFAPVWIPSSSPRNLLPGEEWVYLRKEPQKG